MGIYKVREESHAGALLRQHRHAPSSPGAIDSSGAFPVRCERQRPHADAFQVGTIQPLETT